MINKNDLIVKLKQYIITQLDTMSKNTPIVGIMNPFITRALNKNYSKLYNVLDLISDDSGNIDIENILTEVLQNLTNSDNFTIHTSFIGDIEMGKGTIKLNIPFTDKKLIINNQDIEEFKNTLISKNL